MTIKEKEQFERLGEAAKLRKKRLAYRLKLIRAEQLITCPRTIYNKPIRVVPADWGIYDGQQNSQTARDTLLAFNKFHGPPQWRFNSVTGVLEVIVK